MRFPRVNRGCVGVYRAQIGALTVRIFFDGCSETVPRILGPDELGGLFDVTHRSYDKAGSYKEKNKDTISSEVVPWNRS